MRHYLNVLLMLACAFTVQSCGHSWIAKPVALTGFKHCNPYTDDLKLLFVPGYEKTALIVEDCNFFPVEKVSIALSVFEFEWYKTFGMTKKVSENLRDLIITFSFERRYQIDLVGDNVKKLRNTTEILGSTSSKNALWVSVRMHEERICETALVHELTHASIWSTNNSHGDPDHLGNRYFGWTKKHEALIDKVNAHLCTLGI